MTLCRSLCPEISHALHADSHRRKRQTPVLLQSCTLTLCLINYLPVQTRPQDGAAARRWRTSQSVTCHHEETMTSGVSKQREGFTTTEDTITSRGSQQQEGFTTTEDTITSRVSTEQREGFTTNRRHNNQPSVQTAGRLH